MQMLRSGCARFRCRGYRSGSGGSAHTQVRFRKVPVQRLGQVRVRVHIARSGSGKVPVLRLGEVSEGSHADT